MKEESDDDKNSAELWFDSARAYAPSLWRVFGESLKRFLGLISFAWGSRCMWFTWEARMVRIQMRSWPKTIRYLLLVKNAKKVKNDVNVHKDTLRVDIDEENPDQHLVSFVFDALYDGRNLIEKNRVVWVGLILNVVFLILEVLLLYGKL